MNEWMDDKGNCRTAPSTPGLLDALIKNIKNYIGINLTSI